ncbi:MAG: PAS domain S-box protein [Chitinophagaceae bacterium]|nr:PAS domain S-box protein [Anaerolineae bacterium]
MLRHIRGSLTATAIEDELRNYAADVLRTILYIVFVGLTINIAFLLSIGSDRATLSGVALTLAILCNVLLRRHVELASILFLSGTWLILVISCWQSFGINNDSFHALIMVIILAAVLVSELAGILFAICSLLMGIVLVMAERQGMIAGVPNATPELSLILNAIIFFAASALFFTTGRLLRTLIIRLNEREKLLQIRNEDLEQEVIARRRSEATSRESEEKYRVLFENTGLPTAVYNREGQIILMNESALRQVNKSLEEVIGKTAYEIFPKANAEVAMAHHDHVLQTGMGEWYEVNISLPGKEIYHLINMQPLRNTEGEIAFILVVVTDITSHKRAEQQQLELTLAKQKADFFKEFLGTVSHDIKTPLSTINTSLYLLERSPDAEYRQEKLDQLKEQTKLLDKYIQDILTISKLDHLPEINREEVDINSILQEITQQLYSGAEKKQLELVTDLKSSMPNVFADADQIKRALMNLAENAINYTPSGGTVAIRTTIETDAILVEINDTGIGIEPNELKRIFEQFYRTQQGRRFSQSGTGLGLAIVKKIIDIHGFSIDVESSLGKGTRFTVRMPQAVVVA